MMDRKRLSFSSLPSQIRNGGKSILFGDQGTGKSGSLAKYTIDELKRSADKLSSRTDTKALTISVLVHASLIVDAGSANELVSMFVNQEDVLERVGIKVLSVDGLDEVQPEMRKTVLDKAEDYANELGCALVVTSRKVTLVEEPRKGTESLSFCPLSLGRW